MRWLRMLAAVGALSACQTAQLLPPAGLGPALAVQGAQGWMPGRSLQFGDYRTQGAVEGLGVRTRERWKGWTLQGPVLRAHTELERTQKRLRFQLQERDGERAVTVTASGSLRADQASWSLLLPGIDLQGSQISAARQRFLGTLLPTQGDQALPGWRFALLSPEGDGGRGVATLGWAHRDGDAPEAALLLLPLRTLQSQDGRHRAALGAGMEAPGFEIHRQGRALAAVSRMNGGQVWFAAELDPELRLVCAGLAATLLLRQELASTL